jgi:quinol monooxygenase YgiN
LVDDNLLIDCKDPISQQDVVTTLEDSMATISRDNDVCTLVNVFIVAPENQERLLQVLDVATRQVMQYLPGFVSANLHRSVDGMHVINYAQWASRESFEAMLRQPEAQSHMAEAMRLASAEPHLYEVYATFDAPIAP